MGQTVWGGRAADSAAGLSWDWIEVAEGIIAVADPMMMVTNLRLIGSEGEVLTALQAAPHLNGIACRLPWQTEVLRTLAQIRHDSQAQARSTEASSLFGTRRRGTGRDSGFVPLT